MYEEVWGGMISRGVDDDADFDPGANFGFVTYNDHHFHLGYWVYAMAYYAQFYPDWTEVTKKRQLNTDWKLFKQRK